MRISPRPAHRSEITPEVGWCGVARIRPKPPPLGPVRHPVTGDFRVGGHYDVAIRSLEGQTYRWGGQYLEIAEPTRLSFTVAYYGWPGDITLTDAPENVITITFAPSGSGTLMTFEQAPLAPNINPTNHEDGWRAAFDKLEQSLSAMVAS